MWLELLALLLGLFGLFYWYMTKDYDHFKKHGIPQDDGKFPFGSILGEIMARKKSVFQICREQYDK